MHPLRSQGGDGRKGRGESLRPFVLPQTSDVPSPILGLGSGRGPGHLPLAAGVAPCSRPFGFGQLDEVFQGQTPIKEIHSTNAFFFPMKRHQRTKPTEYPFPWRDEFAIAVWLDPGLRKLLGLTVSSCVKGEDCSVLVSHLPSLLHVSSWMERLDRLNPEVLPF